MGNFNKLMNLIKQSGFFLFAFSISASPVLYASQTVDQNAEDHIAAARQILDDLYMRDCRDSNKAAGWGAYKYVPSIKKGPLDGSVQRTFKLLRAQELLLSPEADDTHCSFWILRPLSKLKLENSIDRMPISSKEYTRTTNPIIDINCDGSPEIIFGSRDFSAHGTWHYWVYTLGKTAKLYSEFPDSDLWQTIFADIDADGKYEAIRFDMTFQSWYDSEAGSTAPCLILSAGPKGFSFNQTLMRRSALTDEQFKTLAESIRKEFQPASEYYDTAGVKESKADFVVSPRLWRIMLELIYSGNSRQSWELLDRVWPKGKSVLLTTFAPFQANQGKANDDKLHPKTKEQFESEFRSRLSGSSYFDDLCRLNAADKRLQGAANPGTSAGLAARTSTKSQPAAAVDKTSYKRYLNARYKFGVDYPGSLKPGREPDNGDGLSFSSANGKVELLAYGMNLYGTIEGDAWTASTLLDSELKNRLDETITLKVKGDNWVVLSGYTGDQIFYFRGIIGKDGVKCFQFKYPKNERSTYDKMVPHLAKSLQNTP